MLVTDWEELWDMALALRSRGVDGRIKNVKALTSDEALASKEQQAGNWLANKRADQGAQACQLTESEVRPIMKKDRVFWQLHSRMIAVLQTMPTGTKIVKDQLVVSQPTAQEKLGKMGHQVEAQSGRLLCQRCGQQWQDKHHYIGDVQCPGPAVEDYHRETDHG
eukprot:8172861-Karenia_brevis.AAC.1